ncbi:MAG: cation-transporting P-type ATPase [Actinomycetota bacterium]|nr:cation-transporting P-type ATPase [Actinomycetota bacterium]
MPDAVEVVELERSRHATPPEGLDAAAVRDRVERGLTNAADERTSRTFKEIARANLLTRFNAILGTMLVIIVVVGPLQDALFGVVLVANALIGIVQEWRAKRALDRLAVLNAPRARVVRDGEVREIPTGEVVLDDLLELRAGDQVAADGVVRASDGLEIDESLLTGESEPVVKAVGDEVLSGSVAVAGSARAQAMRVGADAYAHRLATEARRFTLVRSELGAGIDRILRLVTWALPITAVLLAFSQFQGHHGWRTSLSGIVAGVVAVVPEGLVLLSSLALAVATLTLARRRVLVQELPAVEGLARVDVVCLDKTGTLTEGTIRFHAVHLLGSNEETRIGDALGAMAADEHPNATLYALSEAFPQPVGWERSGATPFSSARKWSAATFRSEGIWVLGAPEMVWRDAGHAARVEADELAAAGHRVLMLAGRDRSLPDVELSAAELPAGLEPAALVTFEERVRDDAPETLRYFAQQGVTLKVISGDNPRTVGAVAARVGLPGSQRVIDARELPTADDELAEVVEANSVFGRVSPQQKRRIVGALQARGHTVAMTGDGVNDALALKDADIGIAMGNGAAATRAVAQLVLLDSNFASLPGIVAEGRRVIANVERVANLFVTKTVYAVLLAVAVGVARWPYPFLPRHLTIVSSFTIGIPAFLLALAPNAARSRPGFVERVLRFALPAGSIVAVATFVAYWNARGREHLSLTGSRTTATIVLLVAGLAVLALLARPLTPPAIALVAGMAGGIGLLFALPEPRRFYALGLPPGRALISAAVIAAIAMAALEAWWTLDQRRLPPDRRVPRLAPGRPAV